MEDSNHDGPGRNNEGQDQGGGSDASDFFIAGLNHTCRSERACHSATFLSSSFPTPGDIFLST